jgi:uncharacterized membrane protein YadS
LLTVTTLSAGSSIQEVAQVVTAGTAVGNKPGEIAVMVKLIRVAALIPAMMILSGLISKGIIIHGKACSDEPVKFPSYLLGFVLLVILNSLKVFPPSMVRAIEFANMFFLTMSMAAIGLKIDIAELRKDRTPKVMALSLFAAVVIAASSYVLVKFLIPVS